MVYDEEGRREKAGHKHRRAVQLEPNHPPTHHHLGIWLSRQTSPKHLSSAARRLRRATELDPEYGTAWNWLAYVSWKRGKLEQADDAFRRACELMPNDRSPFLQYGDFCEKHDRKDEATKHFERALEITPENREAVYRLGICLAELGRFAQARPWLERLLSFDTRDSRATQAAALLHQLP